VHTNHSSCHSTALITRPSGPSRPRTRANPAFRGGGTGCLGDGQHRISPGCMLGQKNTRAICGPVPAFGWWEWIPGRISRSVAARVQARMQGRRNGCLRTGNDGRTWWVTTPASRRPCHAHYLGLHERHQCALDNGFAGSRSVNFNVRSLHKAWPIALLLRALRHLHRRHQSGRRLPRVSQILPRKFAIHLPIFVTPFPRTSHLPDLPRNRPAMTGKTAQIKLNSWISSWSTAKL
jgi:hypothetical protein